MKAIRELHFTVSRNTQRGIAGVVRDYDLSGANSELSEIDDLITVRLAADDMRWQGIRNSLHRLGQSFVERLDVEYDQNDLDSASWLVLRSSGAEKWFSGCRAGTVYDFADACPACGTGARQLSALRLLGARKSKNKQCVNTLDDDLIVSADVATALESALVDRGCLRRVELAKTHSLSDWWQLLPRQTLPRMAQESLGLTVEDQCPVCKRDGHYDDMLEPFIPAYPIRDLNEISDPIAYTYECYGKSSRTDRTQVHLAKPRVLINAGVARILKDIRVRDLDLVPVRTHC